MASIALTIFALSTMLFQLSSCKKAEAQTNAVVTIEGLWIGTYTVDGQPSLGSQYFSFIVKPDGTIINDTKGANKQHLSVGTWNLDGTSFTSSFTCVFGTTANVGVSETSTASFDNTGKLTGTWKNVAPITGSGTFSLTKVK